MFGFLNNKSLERIAFVDVSSSSVRAAYALMAPGKPVRIVYETKIGIEGAGATVGDTPMLRALDAALRDLRSEGGPLLRKAAGSGSASRVVASVCAPWQHTALRVETIIEEKPFTVNEGHIRSAFGKAPPAPGHIQTEETVVATLLNGYETGKPVGKRAVRAEIIVLSATMGEETYAIMRRTLAGLAESHQVAFSTFASVSYRSLRSAFPHQEDFLTVRVSGEASEFCFVKRGFPISTGAVAEGLNSFSRAARESGISAYGEAGPEKGIIDRSRSAALHGKLEEAEKAWVAETRETLRSLAASHALPRTVFLLTDDEARGFVTRLLDAPELHSLWLSDEPLSIVALDSRHFSSFILRDRSFAGNAPLDLLAVATLQ